jgi:hypothetical protein
MREIKNIEVEKAVTYDIDICMIIFMPLIVALFGGFLGCIVHGLMIGIILFLSSYILMMITCILLSRQVKYFVKQK